MYRKNIKRLFRCASLIYRRLKINLHVLNNLILIHTVGKRELRRANQVNVIDNEQLFIFLMRRQLSKLYPIA